MRKYRKWRDIVIAQLTADWDAAIDYIQFALEEYQVDGDAPVLLLSLKTFVESQGGITELGKKTDMDAHILSEVLSSDAAPRIDTLVTILNALGCRLSIEPLKDEERLSDLEPTAEMESSKFTNAETQLTGSNSPQ